ncbi:MAG: hypothetical protein EZS28_005216 [Streblomastix strix]|uniref:Uncharacterized protein n=1 Tax=Streblomastix strix TaxID=222440 RepID=A0A5J4WY09_9EUKA|nr:MAG: hypothetical protein EZS28_005216 [Streblomastix strix]
MSEFDLKQIEKEARQEFETEKGQGLGVSGAGGMMDIDGMEDDYDYYESQASRQDRMKSRAKPFGRLPFHPSMIQTTRKHGGPQFREEAGDVLATLVGYLNRDMKKINSLSVLEQDLDDNVATPDNVVVFDKKKNAIYSVDGYTTAVGFGDLEHQHKRNWKKKYYSDVNDLERAALAAKLKASGIKGGPYMKWLLMTKPHKVREIKNFSFRAFTVNAKKIINQNGGAQLPMAIKQQIMASAWNSVLISPAPKMSMLELRKHLVKPCNIMVKFQHRDMNKQVLSSWPQLFIKVFDSIHPIHTVQSKVIHQRFHFFVNRGKTHKDDARLQLCLQLCLRQ